MQTSSRARPGYWLLIILICFCTFFFRIGSLPFIGADEPRYARIAEEMSQEGRWVTPILEGRPWLEKPPLYYWTTIPFYRLFGVSEATARLGPALLSVMSAFFVYWMGARLWGKPAGLFAAIIFVTSVGVVAFGRSASTDMPLTACFTAAMAILGVAAVEEVAAWKVWCAYLFLALSILGKGPVAFLLWAGIALTFWLLDERGDVMRRWRVLPGLLIVAAASLPWFWLAFRENGFAFVAIFIVNHNIARYITDIHHHTQPVYYFLPVLPGLFFPWSAWLLLAWPRRFGATLRNWREWDRRSLFLACWALFPLLFFSFSRSKLPGYILPCFPPLALLVGARIFERCRSAGPDGLVPAACAHLILSAALALAFPMAFLRDYGGSLRAAALVSACCLIPALFSLYHARQRRPAAAFNAVAVQGVALVLVLAQFAFPAIGSRESAREIALQVLESRENGEPVIAYNYFSHALNYYTKYRVSGEIPDPASLDRYLQTHPRILIVTESSHLPEIEELKDYSVVTLGEQGLLRLLRVQRKAR